MNKEDIKIGEDYIEYSLPIVTDLFGGISHCPTIETILMLMDKEVYLLEPVINKHRYHLNFMNPHTGDNGIQYRDVKTDKTILILYKDTKCFKFKINFKDKIIYFGLTFKTNVDTNKEQHSFTYYQPMEIKELSFLEFIVFNMFTVYYPRK